MKTSKIIRIVLIMVTVILTGCTNTSKKQEEDAKVNNVKTETDALKEIFPNLEGIESTQWEYERMTTEGRTPGPSDYRYRGIIVLDNGTAEKYRNQYEWTEVTEELEAEYLDLSVYENETWHGSDEMKADIMSVGYIGDVYLGENYIWFDVITQ